MSYSADKALQRYTARVYGHDPDTRDMIYLRELKKRKKRARSHERRARWEERHANRQRRHADEDA